MKEKVYYARNMGNSIAVTIPTFVVHQLDIDAGDELLIELKEKTIQIRKKEK